MALRRLTKATLLVCLTAGVARGQTPPARQANQPPPPPEPQQDQGQTGTLLAPGFYAARPPVSEPPAGFLGPTPGTFPPPERRGPPPQPPAPRQPLAQPQPSSPREPLPQPMPPPMPQPRQPAPSQPLPPPQLAPMPRPQQMTPPPAAMGPEEMPPQPPPRGLRPGPGPLPEPMPPMGPEVREPGAALPPQPGSSSNVTGDEMGPSPQGLAQGQPYPAFEGEQTEQPHVLYGSVVRVADEAVQVKVGQRVVELLLTPGTLVVKGNAPARLDALAPGTEVRAHYVVTEGERIATRLQVAAPGAPLPKPAPKPGR